MRHGKKHVLTLEQLKNGTGPGSRSTEALCLYNIDERSIENTGLIDRHRSIKIMRPQDIEKEKNGGGEYSWKSFGPPVHIKKDLYGILCKIYFNKYKSHIEMEQYELVNGKFLHKGPILVEVEKYITSVREWDQIKSFRKISKTRYSINNMFEIKFVYKKDHMLIKVTKEYKHLTPSAFYERSTAMRYYNGKRHAMINYFCVPVNTCSFDFCLRSSRRDPLLLLEQRQELMCVLNMENFTTTPSVAYKPEKMSNQSIKRLYYYNYSKYKEDFKDKTEDVYHDRINMTMNPDAVHG